MALTKTQQKSIKSVIARLRCDPVRWQDGSLHAGESDEVRDMSRGARELLGIPDCEATDFYELKTPSAWNTVGVNSIIDYYERMATEQRAAYLQNTAHLY